MVGVSNSWKVFAVTFNLCSYLNIYVHGYVISLNYLELFVKGWNNCFYYENRILLSEQFHYLFILFVILGALLNMCQLIELFWRCHYTTFSSVCCPGGNPNIIHACIMHTYHKRKRSKRLSQEELGMATKPVPMGTRPNQPRFDGFSPI